MNDLLIIGFCAGFAFAILFAMGHDTYQEYRRRKREEDQRVNDLIKSWHSQSSRYAPTKEDMRYISHSDELRRPPYPVITSMHEMLQQAIESEDYEEAARLRDLIKQNNISN
jgi:protein-arginine kinase activator protein McsA